MNILELQLQTARLEKLKTFYSKILGLEVLEEDEQKVILAVGSSVLCLTQNMQRPAGSYHFAFAVAVDNCACCLKV